MNVGRQINDEQSTLWNGGSGHAWVELQALLDDVLSPFEDLLVEAVSRTSAGRVLDIGCGAGGTTLAVARSLGAKGRCTGIDISEPLIAAAKVRAEREHSMAKFVCGDAQTHAFAPASFDMFVSRFGVMFFDDSVKAFANLHRAAKGGAELRFVVWRGPEENPYMTTAERAAASLLPNVPPRRPDAPGQFAFADGRRFHRILEDSGWAGVDIRPIDVPCSFPESELVRYFTRLGPLARVLDEADEPTRIRVVEKVRVAFDPYVHGDEVRFDAACWMACARSSTRAV
jgi:SAM-dependent methyltransferase